MQPSYPPAARKQNFIQFLGIPVHQVGAEEVQAFIGEVIRQKTKALILNLNIHCVCLAWRHDWLKEFLHQVHLVFVDGDGIRWGLRILGFKPPPKIPFTRWIWSLAAFSAQNGFSLFFLGAQPGVAEEAAQRLKARYPELKIAGTYHGYFERKGRENEQVIEKINQAKADILIGGFGMPIQEEWLAQNWRKLDVHIFLPAGAVFDYTAGRLHEAPRWMLRLNLEWFFRIWEEPRRLFWRYFTEIPYFFWRVFLFKFQCLISRRSQKELPGSSAEKS